MPVAAAGALVVVVAVIGALALRSPAPAAAPRSSAPLTGSPPLVLDLPAHPRGGEAALAAVAADIGAGRRARPRRPCGARATCWARATCACRSPERCCATARARWTPRSACCARSCPTTTALPCRRCISGWRCSGPGSAAEATAELEQTRSLDPDGLYGRTADNVLHPSYRKNYPLWVRSRFVHGSLAQLRAKAVAAPRSQPAQLDYAYALQFSSRTRARLVAEKALALDAGNIDAQVAVIVLGFDKDVPAQAVGPLGQLMQSRAGEPSPRFHFGELLSWIGQNAKAKEEYRQASALDPKGLIGRFARSVLKASG